MRDDIEEAPVEPSLSDHLYDPDRVVEIDSPEVMQREGSTGLLFIDRDTATLSVSRGALPDVYGESVDSATALLAENDLSVAGTTEEFRDDLDAGRLDLTAVEAIADLVSAETEAQRRQAMRVFSGSLGQKAEEWRAKLVEQLAEAPAGDGPQPTPTASPTRTAKA